jgi:type VI secretion system protein ImpF
MPRVDNEIRITPSVLDRLLDDRPEETREAPASRQTSLRLLKDSVRRDLEWLLNTRWDPGAPSPGQSEIGQSVAAFGLPDVAAVNVHTAEGREGLKQAVETAVRVFEPRLEGVRVALENVSQNERAVTFRIEAQLRVEPAPEPVVFDTMLQAGSGGFRVKER